jgi:hypothetical protein
LILICARPTSIDLGVDVAGHGGLEIFQARLVVIVCASRCRSNNSHFFVLSRRCGHRFSVVVFWGWVFFFVGHDVILSQVLP